MSYTASTDFLALLRQTSGGMRAESMPGLDYVVVAMARAGMINLVVGQTAPTTSQINTAWFKPALPSWTAEGTLYLWNDEVNQYTVANPDLWSHILSIGQTEFFFQSVNVSTATVSANTSILAIQRAAPVLTVLSLPSVVVHHDQPLQIVDWSTAVTNHQIMLVPTGAETIMQRNPWTLLSTADQLAGITLYPSVDLAGWIIAP